MICPDCLGDGVIIVDETHTDICGMCDGYGHIGLDEAGNGNVIVEVERPNDNPLQ